MPRPSHAPDNAQPLVIFSHGNSFPASTYRVMLDDVRRRGFEVQSLEKFGHNPAYPVTSNWSHLVHELLDFAQPLAAQHRGPVFLVGHSLGGILSLMAASRAPALAQGVVLIDSPVLGGWLAKMVGVAKHIPMAERFSPGAISRHRRQHWNSEAEVLAHFQRKKAFAHWDPRVLQDYVHFGTHDEQTAQGVQRVLSFSREVETAIYNSIPHHLEALLKRHPLQCPAALIAARHSREMRRVGRSLTDRITKGRVTMLDGTHLVPMEKPIATAAALEATLLNLASVNAALKPPR